MESKLGVSPYFSKTSLKCASASYRHSSPIRTHGMSGNSPANVSRELQPLSTIRASLCCIKQTTYNSCWGADFPHFPSSHVREKTNAHLFQTAARCLVSYCSRRLCLRLLHYPLGCSPEAGSNPRPAAEMPYAAVTAVLTVSYK